MHLCVCVCVHDGFWAMSNDFPFANKHAFTQSHLSSPTLPLLVGHKQQVVRSHSYHLHHRLYTHSLTHTLTHTHLTKPTLPLLAGHKQRFVRSRPGTGGGGAEGSPDGLREIVMVAGAGSE